MKLNNDDYHNYVFLAIKKSDWEKLLNEKDLPLECKEFLQNAREEYKRRNINKKWSSKVASRTKTNKAFKKCAIALYFLKNNLFDNDKLITPYRLMKEAGVHFNTAKKFLEKYKWEIENNNIDLILKEFNIDLNKI